MTGSSFSRRGLIQASAASSTAVAGSAALAQDDAARGHDLDLALVNGRILTMDGRNSTAPALGIRDGRIAAVGTLTGKAARTIDLKGATVVPGLIDAHHHIYWAYDNPGNEARDVELARSIPELLRAIAQKARSVPAGQFITCNGGWTRRGLAERRLPTLAELDAAAPNHPVWLSETQSEAAWIDPETATLLPAQTNSRGLAFFQARGLRGDASGQVHWPKSVAVLQKEQSNEKRLNDAIDFCVGVGLTTIHDFGNGHAMDPSLDAALPYVLDMWRNQTLKLRFRLRMGAPRGSGLDGLVARMTNGISRLGDDVVRLNGFGEGIGGGGDGPDDFAEAAKAVARHGWSAHVHSVDLPEISGHVAGFQAANEVRSLDGLRWSLGHANRITPQLALTLKGMGVGVTGDAWPYTTDLAELPGPLGPPWRMLVDSGMHIGAGSDGSGAAGVSPWITIYYMTTGRNSAGELANDPAQSLSRLEALKVHTLGSAWHSFDDHYLGSLEVGKLADLAVLSHDPLTVSDDDLRRITSSLTLQAGKVVHEAG